MKLVHEVLETSIEFTENKINVLVLENKKYFIELIQELDRQINGIPGRFILSVDGKEIDIKKYVDIVFSLFSIELNSKKILNTIYSDIETNIINEYVKEQYELYSLIESFIIDKIDNYPINLSINDEVDIDMILKDLKVQVDESGLNIQEKLLDYLRISQEILENRCTILVNAKQLFMNDEIEYLYNEILYNKQNVLFIESGLDNRCFPQEQTLLIDNDLCEIIY